MHAYRSHSCADLNISNDDDAMRLANAKALLNTLSDVEVPNPIPPALLA